MVENLFRDNWLIRNSKDASLQLLIRRGIVRPSDWRLGTIPESYRGAEPEPDAREALGCVRGQGRVVGEGAQPFGGANDPATRFQSGTE